MNLCGVCSPVVGSHYSVCDLVVVPYVVAAVVAVINVFMLRECEGARVTAMLVWGPGRCGCVYGWYTWFV